MSGEERQREPGAESEDARVRRGLELRSALAWALARKRGGSLQEVASYALRNGGDLPHDPAARREVVDALAGKLDAPRRRGRPKGSERPDYVRAAVEASVAECYDWWLAAFRDNRPLAWLHSEAARLLARGGEGTEALRGVYQLDQLAERQRFARDLRAAGARDLSKRGTGRELALKATAHECGRAWEAATGEALRASQVARLVARARKAE